MLASCTHTRAGEPGTIRGDVDLARGVVVSEESARKDGHDVLVVVDARHRDWARVDVVGPLLVAYARYAVADELGGDAGDVGVKEDGVEKSDRTA